MDDIIDQIKYDHISMSRILFIMEQEVHRIGTDVDPDYNLLVDCMHYMVNYTDVVHHPKEDAMLARIAERTDDLREITDEINMQHRSLGVMSQDFYEITKNAAAEEFVSLDEIKRIGQEYIRAQRKHIGLEEGSLLRRVRKYLTDEDIAAVNDQYKNHWDPQLSENFEREYEHLYHSLMP